MTRRTTPTSSRWSRPPRADAVGRALHGPDRRARVGIIDGTLTLNPTLEQMKTTDLDLVVAGTQDALMMVESEAQELPEDRMIEALMFAHREMQPVIEAIIELAEHAAKEPFDFQAEITPRS
jgi:polyribonucleotide nucleotidyltransferase